MSKRTLVTAQLDLEPGSIVEGRYELVSLLGEGGFAAVYEAFDASIERTVALKILDVGLVPNDKETRNRLLSRFQREAQVAARIDHPGVVGIYDYGFIGDRVEHPYIVMERLHGRDLEEQIFERGPLAPDRAIPLFIGALEALGEAHSKGIVHKDLKPGNIFYTHPGEPHESLRIVDFGVAFMENAAEGRLTKTGEILGTPNYLAPEYINEQIATPALDVYQMGLILLEMLSARRVVSGSTAMRCLYTHISGELEIPKALVDSELGPVLTVALAQDHERRFADGRAFANALRTVDPSAIPRLPDGDIPMARPLTQSGQQDGGSTETENLEGRDRQDSGQTRLGIGELEEFDTGRFLTEARRTGALSAKQTNRLIELDEVYGAHEDAERRAATTREDTPIPRRDTPAPRPETQPVGIESASDEPTGPQGGLEARAPSMWEFTGDAFSDDETDSAAAAEAEVYDPGRSNLKLVMMALGLLLVVGAGSVGAYLLVTAGEGDSKKASPEKAASETADVVESVEGAADEAETAVEKRAASSANDRATRAEIVAVGLAESTGKPSDDVDEDRQSAASEATEKTKTTKPERRPTKPTKKTPPTRVEKSLWVKVDSTPEGALVTTEGKLVGKTPCKVKFEPSETSQRVKFDKDGYEPLTIQLRRDDHPGRTVQLKQKAAEPEPPADESANSDESDESDTTAEDDKPGLKLAP
jgi:serine/threonine protein kinase